MQPQYYTFEQMVADKLYKIPNYQRAYSWITEQRKDLFEDIRKIADVEDESRHHFMATIVVLKTREVRRIGTKNFEVMDVVDGQQRLTTLVMLLKSISIHLKEVLNNPSSDEGMVSQRESIQEELAEIEKTLVKRDIDQSILLHTNHDNAQIFQSYLRRSAMPEKNQLQTMADRNFANGFNDCAEFVKKWVDEDKREIFSLLQIVRNRLSFILYQIEDDGSVYRVFETLNSRGLEVDWLDKCKSVLMGIAFEMFPEDLRKEKVDELHRVWSNIYREIGVVNIPGHEILRFAATLKYSEEVNKLLGATESVEFFRGYCLKNGMGSVLELSEWIRVITEKLKWLYTNRRLGSVTKIVHARLLAVSLMLTEGLNSEDRKYLLDQWERVTFRIFGMCGKDARTKVGEYVSLSHYVASTYSTPTENGSEQTRKDLLERLIKLGKGYSIEKAVEALEEDDCYNQWGEELRYFMYRYEESLAGNSLNDVVWNTIWSETSYNTIEHVLPQNFRVEDLEAGRSKEDHEILVNRLGNLGILPPGINSKAKHKSFPDKKNVYEENGVAGIKLMKEVMDKEKWDEDAIDEREKRLLAWARNIWCDLP